MRLLGGAETAGWDVLGDRLGRDSHETGVNSWACCEQKRGLPPLKEDQVPVFFALNVIGHVTMEDLVMEERMHLIGVWEHWQGAMQDPPVKGVLEQSRIEKERNEPGTGADNCDEIRHVRTFP